MIYNSKLMKNLMMDLLDLAQMENNTFKLNKSFFSLSEVINKACSVVNHIAQKKEIILETQID